VNETESVSKFEAAPAVTEDRMRKDSVGQLEVNESEPVVKFEAANHIREDSVVKPEVAETESVAESAPVSLKPEEFPVLLDEFSAENDDAVINVRQVSEVSQTDAKSPLIDKPVAPLHFDTRIALVDPSESDSIEEHILDDIESLSDDDEIKHILPVSAQETSQCMEEISLDECPVNTVKREFPGESDHVADINTESNDDQVECLTLTEDVLECDETPKCTDIQSDAVETEPIDQLDAKSERSEITHQALEKENITDTETEPLSAPVQTKVRAFDFGTRARVDEHLTRYEKNAETKPLTEIGNRNSVTMARDVFEKRIAASTNKAADNLAKQKSFEEKSASGGKLATEPTKENSEYPELDSDISLDFSPRFSES